MSMKISVGPHSMIVSRGGFSTKPVKISDESLEKIKAKAAWLHWLFLKRKCLKKIRNRRKQLRKFRKSKLSRIYRLMLPAYNISERAKGEMK